MRFVKIKNKAWYLVFIFLVTLNCNYKPLFNEEQFGKLNFKNIEISGDKRVAQIIVNKLNIIQKPSGKYSLLVDADKKVVISNKSITGKVLEYSITITCQVKIRNNITMESIYTKEHVNSENYKASKLYSDTINSEKRIIQNTSNLIAKQILNEVSLVLRDDN